MGGIGVSAGGTWSQFLAVTRNMPQFEGNGPNREESSSVDCAISYYGRSDMRRAYEGSAMQPWRCRRCSAEIA